MLTFDTGFLLEAIPAVVGALPVTLAMVLASAPAGWLIGYGLARVRVRRVPVASQLAAVFVSMMRSVPEVVLLYVSYYFLPVVIYNALHQAGVEADVAQVPAIAFAIVTFVLNQSAYACEVLRAAIESVDPSQLEAALACGMTRGQAMRRVVLPQALVSALPNLGGLLVGLLHGTSLAYFVGVHEVMAASVLEANQSYAYLEAYVLATIVYEVLSLVINRAFRALERHLGRWRTAGARPR